MPLRSSESDNGPCLGRRRKTLLASYGITVIGETDIAQSDADGHTAFAESTELLTVGLTTGPR